MSCERRNEAGSGNGASDFETLWCGAGESRLPRHLGSGKQHALAVAGSYVRGILVAKRKIATKVHAWWLTRSTSIPRIGHSASAPGQRTSVPAQTCQFNLGGQPAMRLEGQTSAASCQLQDSATQLLHTFPPAVRQTVRTHHGRTIPTFESLAPGSLRPLTSTRSPSLAHHLSSVRSWTHFRHVKRLCAYDSLSSRGATHLHHGRHRLRQLAKLLCQLGQPLCHHPRYVSGLGDASALVR